MIQVPIPKSTIFTRLLIAASILFSPIRLAMGCAGGEYDEQDIYYHFIPGEEYTQGSYEKLFQVFGYTLLGGNKRLNEDQNIQEWGIYFNNKLNSGQLQNLVYKVRSEALDSCLYSFLKTEKFDKKQMSAIQYLQYAKNCEKHCQEPDDYWEIPVRDTIAMLQLMQAGQSAAIAAKDNFLKRRYAYQAIRLAHYSGKPEQCIKMHDELVEPLGNSSIIYYYSLGHKAGALYMPEVHSTIGNPQAASLYYFSQVYDHCYGRKITWFSQYENVDSETWVSALAMCKSNNEKSTLWMLRGLDPAYPKLEIIKEIWKYDPASDKADLLLHMALQEYMRLSLPQKLNTSPEKQDQGENEPWYEPDIQVSEDAYKNKFMEVYQLSLKYGNKAKIDNWTYGAAMCQYFDGNYKECKIFLDKVSATGFGTRQAELIKGLQLASDLKMTHQLNEAFENRIYGFITTCKNEELSQYIIMLVQSIYYHNDGDLMKYILCKHYFDRDSYWLEMDNLEFLDKLSEYCKRSDLNTWEKYLVGKGYSHEFILGIKGSHYLKYKDFENALLVYNQISNPQALEANPFTIHITDCHDCDLSDPQKIQYTGLTFVKRLVGLKSTAKRNPLNAAYCYFEIANACYNLTWYGNSRSAINLGIYHDWYEDEPMKKEDTYNPTMTCDSAKKYYLLAAKFSQDREFQAKCYFMASKCDLVDFYQEDGGTVYTGTYGYGGNYSQTSAQNLNDNYRQYFRLLKKSYSNTAFYQDAIKECSYFNSFVAKIK